MTAVDRQNRSAGRHGTQQKSARGVGHDGCSLVAQQYLRQRLTIRIQDAARERGDSGRSAQNRQCLCCRRTCRTGSPRQVTTLISRHARRAYREVDGRGRRAGDSLHCDRPRGCRRYDDRHAGRGHGCNLGHHTVQRDLGVRRAEIATRNHHRCPRSAARRRKTGYHWRAELTCDGKGRACRHCASWRGDGDRPRRHARRDRYGDRNGRHCAWHCRRAIEIDGGVGHSAEARTGDRHYRSGGPARRAELNHGQRADRLCGDRQNIPRRVEGVDGGALGWIDDTDKPPGWIIVVLGSVGMRLAGQEIQGEQKAADRKQPRSRYASAAGGRRPVCRRRVLNVRKNAQCCRQGKIDGAPLLRARRTG